MDVIATARTKGSLNKRMRTSMKNRVRSNILTANQKKLRGNFRIKTAKKKHNSNYLNSIFRNIADKSANYLTKKGGGSSVEKKIKRTRKRGCTKTNPKPPCGSGFYEKISKKGDICCYKQKKTKKNNVDNMYFYLGAY